MEKTVNISAIRERGNKFSEGKRNEIYTDGAVMGSLFSDMINTFGDERKDEFLAYITTDHPTLQQTYFGMVLKSIRMFAEKEHYDGRNENSVMKARMLLKFMEENGISTGCPCI